ncbi:SDR family NAD(P)-dependent oxidoreductase [Streptomyces sp. ICN441]|uniref:Short-chain dehydrogenase n=1 Tax=Streptomyces tirandamycinicus TaxID=2174846 RepID=A0A2S1T254_9ACTN|nr:MULTISPECIES: oxidoreductase [Streptomyces]AWI32754.1 short-chain dehydrogenase [Streptomyces tirandamycinicus]MCY0985419.1 oxidoreductase [Streptomyces tirandamycinicus]NNJ08459.1 SDR family NAD(P)-dependent oxidoreductase [Streptomyces sp. PKU-MA01144]TFE53101.1 SDR family NAD(P)-dependent oxidoreductase [Streptomyces sp. ICN441]
MAWSTAHVPDQSGRTALVTGASGGIGLETARVLAARGAHVVLACRSVERARAAAARIGGSTEAVPLDLASLDSVRDAAAEVRGRHDRLDLLINNAGVMFPPDARTEDGFETHFGVNHLGHFALTGLLLDLMTRVPGSRVVTVASLAHRAGFGGFGAERARSATGRRSVAAYGRSKLANLMFARELQRRFAAAGAATLSLAAHPGLSATGLWHGDPPALLRPVAGAGLRLLAQPADRAALPSLRAATDPRAAGGAYLGPRNRFESRGAPGPARSSRASGDAAAQARLWDLSEELTGVRYAFTPERAEDPPAAAVCPVTGARG